MLYDVTFAHGGAAPRPIVHRMSMPEMTVRAWLPPSGAAAHLLSWSGRCPPAIPGSVMGCCCTCLLCRAGCSRLAAAGAWRWHGRRVGRARATALTRVPGAGALLRAAAALPPPPGLWCASASACLRAHAAAVHCSSGAGQPCPAWLGRVAHCQQHVTLSCCRRGRRRLWRCRQQSGAGLRLRGPHRLPGWHDQQHSRRAPAGTASWVCMAASQAATSWLMRS